MSKNPNRLTESCCGLVFCLTASCQPRIHSSAILSIASSYRRVRHRFTGLEFDLHPPYSSLKKPQPTISPYSRRASSPTAIIMLRRKPTSITLTTEDVAIYEDSRARENHLREQAVLQAQMQAQGTPQKKNQNIRDPNDELRPLPGDRARAQHVKTRDERLGLVGGGGGSSRV
jgi:hypothetical protein